MTDNERDVRVVPTVFLAIVLLIFVGAIVVFGLIAADVWNPFTSGLDTTLDATRRAILAATNEAIVQTATAEAGQ
jgi:hypothetical protein